MNETQSAGNRVITGLELQIGDTVEVWWKGNRDTVIAFEPYTGRLLPLLGEGTRVAFFASFSVGMTICPDDDFRLIARAGKDNRL